MPGKGTILVMCIEQSPIGILCISLAAAAMYAMAHQKFHRCTRRLYAIILSDNF